MLGYLFLFDKGLLNIPCGQRLDAGDDPLKALVLSSEAAVTGAESTKNMRALV